MNLPDQQSQFLVYATQDGKLKIDVCLADETAWLLLDQLATLFQRNKSTISQHINNVFEEGELAPDSVVANFATTAADGKTYQVDYFNLDVIISVGYRVKSGVATRFRIWATQRFLTNWQRKNPKWNTRSFNNNALSKTTLSKVILTNTSSS